MRRRAAIIMNVIFMMKGAIYMLRRGQSVRWLKGIFLYPCILEYTCTEDVNKRLYAKQDILVGVILHFLFSDLVAPYRYIDQTVGVQSIMVYSDKNGSSRSNLLEC